MKKAMTISILIMFSTTLFSQGTLKINVSELSDSQGQIMILLFKKGQDFGIDETPLRKLRCTTITNKEASFSIKNVEKGEYSILLFHDKDSNGELKTNWIGMPKEGIGKSGNADARPTFENTKFYFNGTSKIFNIKIDYL